MKYIFIWQGKTLVRLDLEEITFVSASDSYSKIFLTGDRYCLVRSTLTAVLAKLPTEAFVRTHRTYAVAINHIKTLEQEGLHIGKNFIPISKQYYNAVIARLPIVD
ncbi:LytR/AlgR family response regulator transcription factor [Flavihumibacter petaseus]|nr:LytTR family transcriptional regulator DNA-binding domain-containing protein [Flavihumibacter petaseus]